MILLLFRDSVLEVSEVDRFHIFFILILMMRDDFRWNAFMGNDDFFVIFLFGDINSFAIFHGDEWRVILEGRNT